MSPTVEGGGPTITPQHVDAWYKYYAKFEQISSEPVSSTSSTLVLDAKHLPKSTSSQLQFSYIRQDDRLQVCLSVSFGDLGVGLPSCCTHGRSGCGAELRTLGANLLLHVPPRIAEKGSRDARVHCKVRVTSFALLPCSCWILIALMLRDLEMLKKYVDSLGLEKRGLFKSLTFKMPKIGTSPTMSNSLPAPKPKVLAPPPKVEAPAPAIPAPKIEAPKPPTPPAPAPKVEAPSSIVPAPKVEPPAPVVPAPKVEAPKPPAPASPPPPPPPPVNNPPPNAPPAAAPPAQAPAEAPQSGGWAQKIQGGAETLNAGMGLTSSVMDLVTADKNYATVKVQAEQASQASESSSSAQPAPTA
ncbi:hypothetical protein PTI98_004262 [Pleurotus ostreatus]|nr:hypothetical protein PTI98_004262 [Pleurotus ostreatus]